MKRSRFTDQQIAFALQQAEQGTQVGEVTRKMGISEQTFYRWKKKFGGLMPSEVRKLQHLVAGVVLLSCDEEGILGGELLIPSIISITQVLHDNRAFGPAEAAGFFDFVLPPRLGDGHKGRQIIVVVQESVVSDAPLGAAAGRPRKERQTEAHHRGVKPEKLIFELEFVLRASGWQPRYIRPNSASKKLAGSWLLASVKVARGTDLTPRR